MSQEAGRTGVEQSSADDIYVQIPAYRDQELSKTLVNLYGKAAKPQRLRVAVMWQHGEQETLAPGVRDLPNLEIIEIPFQQSKGCNWARNILQQKWRGEAYTLLLDSHQRFSQDWDVTVVRMLRELQNTGSAKPILTAYLPGYDPEREPGARKKRPYKMYPKAWDEGILVKLTSFPIPNWTRLRQPVEADFVSLHFLFAAGSLNRELPFDPEIYFFGDETLMSARAYTSGYDLFHPHTVVGWHSYKRDTRVGHWADHDGWHKQHQRSLEKMRALLKGEHAGPHGLGTERTIEEYQERILCDLVRQ